MENLNLFNARYEDNYLRRELDKITSNPDIALTELIANAFDAGAKNVRILIPSSNDQLLIVEDDGIGLTKEEFAKRWMTLRYNRVQDLGEDVIFPKEYEGLKRKAYGRNGVGRHGLLCFADSYELETKKNGQVSKFTLEVGSSDKPIKVVSFQESEEKGHGTKLKVRVTRNLCDSEKMAELLSAKFLHDPSFTVHINGKAIPLSEHPGKVESEEIKINNNIDLKVTVVDSTKSSVTNKHQGIAFWVGGRLVGKPEWALFGTPVLDGRRRFSKRYTIVVESNDLYPLIKEDWSGFKRGHEDCNQIKESLNSYIQSIYKKLSFKETNETKRDAIKRCGKEIANLSDAAKKDISHFIDDILEENPALTLEILTQAVKAAINLEKSRQGISLLTKLESLSENDVAALDKILDEWNVQDALIVLEEIDQRLSIIEAIDKLSRDKTTDELHTLHPLLLKARWIFEPKYESPEYSSNVTLQNTILKVFGKKIDKSNFSNPSKRPDIVALASSSISGSAIDGVDSHGLSEMKDVLLIELKKGGFPINRKEMRQAEDYLQEIAYCGIMDSPLPHLTAYVVGYEISPKTATILEVKDDTNTPLGTVKATTYSRLVRTAQTRMFKLREKIASKYNTVEEIDLINKILGEQPAQINMELKQPEELEPA
ncbi:MAG: ATP-binding protein [bacterium]